MPAENVLIGYYLSLQGGKAIVDAEGSLLVCGTAAELQHHITETLQLNPEQGSCLPVDYEGILNGMNQGYSFALDEAAYQIFQPRAVQDGFSLQPEDFSVGEDGLKQFATLGQSKRESNPGS
jgi:hypothetical protein